MRKPVWPLKTGTTAVIGMEYDIECKYVGLHWDGYADHAGRMLTEHCDTRQKTEELSYGDIVDLRSTLKLCVFRVRDHGDLGTVYATKTVPLVRDAFRVFPENDIAPYVKKGFRMLCSRGGADSDVA